jgi:hypothetical protein
LVGGEAFGVVIDRPEVEARAEAREVTGIGGRVYALSLKKRQAKNKSITRVRGVDMKVAE